MHSVALPMPFITPMPLLRENKQVLSRERDVGTVPEGMETHNKEGRASRSNDVKWLVWAKVVPACGTKR